jgi:hypothetical protein
MIAVDKETQTGYISINNPTCVGKRRNTMNTQFFLFDPSTGVIHGQPPGFSPTQAVGGSFLFKACTKCGKSLPRSEYYKDKSRRDGLQSHCKKCNALACKMYALRNPEKVYANARKWQKANPDRHAAHTRRWQKANPEKVRAKWNKWRESNPERVAEIGRRWGAANSEKVAAKTRRWRKANPDKRRASEHRHRSAKLNAPGSSYTKAHHISARWEMYGNKCWVCGKPAEHTDHVIPLNAGGSHWPSNLRPACAKCNVSRPKNGRDLPTRSSM